MWVDPATRWGTIPRVEDLIGIDLTQLLTAVGVLLVGVLLALVVRRLVLRGFSGTDSTPGAASLVARLIQLVIVSGVVIYVLNILGIRIAPLLGALGIGGIALALAVQSVLTNAVASVLLQVRRPFKRGDQIVTNDIEGTVVDVDLRTVRVLTFDGNDVLVPAATVLDNPITNFTKRRSQRTELDIGLAYETDLVAAQRVLLHATAGVEGVHPEPVPEAWVYEFGESTINVALRYWHDARVAVMWRTRSDVAMAVKRALDEAGFVIEFPQRVVTVKPAPGPDESGA